MGGGHCKVLAKMPRKSKNVSHLLQLQGHCRSGSALFEKHSVWDSPSASLTSLTFKTDGWFWDCKGEDTNDDKDDKEERLINLITRTQYRQADTIVGDQGTVEYDVVYYTVLSTFSAGPWPKFDCAALSFHLKKIQTGQLASPSQWPGIHQSKRWPVQLLMNWSAILDRWYAAQAKLQDYNICRNLYLIPCVCIWNGRHRLEEHSHQNNALERGLSRSQAWPWCGNYCHAT